MNLQRLLSARYFYNDPILGYTPDKPDDWNNGRPQRDQLLAFLRRAALQGYTGLVTVSDLTVLEALRAGERPLPVIPMIPNVAGYVRDAVDHGLVGAGLRRLRRLPPLSLARVLWTGMRQAPGVLRKQTAAQMRILFEMELAAFRPFQPKRVLLAPQITDLAVAFDHPELVRAFLARMTRGGMQAGLATNNPLALLARLKAWKLTPPWLLAPVNRRGYLMQPAPSQWETALQAGDLQVTADVVGVGTRPGQDDEDYLQSLGIEEMVLDGDRLFAS